MAVAMAVTTKVEETTVTAPFHVEATSQVATAGPSGSTILEVSGWSVRLSVVFMITALTIAGNCFAIFVINLKKQSFTSGKLWEVRLVTSLFYSDLLLGLTVMFLAFLSGVQPEATNWQNISKLQVFFIIWCGSCSIYNMAAVSFVKMLAIARPLQFELEVTSKRCWAGIACIWLIAVVISAPVLTDFAETAYAKPLLISTMGKGNAVLSTTFTILVYIPATSVISVSYWKIFRIVLKHKRRIADISVLLDGSSNGQYQRVVSAIKSAKKMMVITGVYYSVFTPLAILLASGDIKNPESQERWYVFVILWNSLGNSWYNCMLYLLLHKKNRTAVKQVLSCQKNRSDISAVVPAAGANSQ